MDLFGSSERFELAMTIGNNLSHNRQGNLFGRSGPDIQPDGTVDAPDLLVCQDLVFEPLGAFLARLATADRADVASAPREHNL